MFLLVFGLGLAIIIINLISYLDIENAVAVQARKLRQPLKHQLVINFTPAEIAAAKARVVPVLETMMLAGSLIVLTSFGVSLAPRTCVGIAALIYVASIGYLLWLNPWSLASVANLFQWVFGAMVLLFGFVQAVDYNHFRKKIPA